MPEIKNQPDKNTVPKGSGFCQEPSDKFLKMIAEADDDPRSAMGWEAIRALKKGLNIRQPADAREPGGLTPN